MERTGFEQWKPREVARLLALVETERRYYQEMMALLPAALVVISSERTVVASNRAFRSLFHLRSEDLRQKAIEQVLPSNELIERIRAAHVHADTAPFRLNLGERSFRVSIVPIRNWEEDMEPETLLMLDDLTGFAAAPAVSVAPKIEVPAIPAVVWQADAATLAFTFAGGATESILGYSSEHWLTTPRFMAQRIHPEDRDRVMTLYQALATAGGQASAEFRAIAASGEPVWCRETVRVANAAGHGLVAAGVLTAIDQRRQMEAQSIIAGRSDALRALAARLSHDLNNPLMIVAGYAEEVLQALPQSDPLRGDLAEILAATRRMSELTAQVLAFTRPAVNTPVKIALRDVTSALPARLQGLSGVPTEVELAAAARGVWIFAGLQQLEEAIAALASAALENTRDVSKLSVVCQTTLIAEQVQPATLVPGTYVRLEIRAAGAGQGTAAAGIFESFLPAKDPLRNSGPAAARAYATIRQWGGDVVFSSEPDKGSTFSIYLPSAEPENLPGTPAPESRAETAPAPEPQPEPVPEPESPRETILVVEDEPGIRGLVRKILRRENYVVVEAGSAEEALTFAASFTGNIDLLLTDVMLPGMNGRELAQALRRANSELKVVYISGYTDDESVRAGAFPPGARFLQKPFTLGALTSTIRETLEA